MESCWCYEFEFRSLMFWGKKLLLSLSVFVIMLLKRLSDGSNMKRRLQGRLETSWEDKSCVFVRNKSIKMFLTSNHNNASSSESVLVWIRREICSDQTPFTKQLETNIWLDFDVRDNMRWTFSLQEALLWTHILAGSNNLKLKTFVSYKCTAFVFSRC